MTALPAGDLVSRIMGVDPGLSGAIVLLTADQLTIWDMPTVLVQRTKPTATDPGKNKRDLDYQRVGQIFLAAKPTSIWIEEVGGMPGQGGPASFRFGETFGALKAFACSTGAPTYTVRPRVWQQATGATSAKERNRQIASRRFPAFAAFFTKASDDGRADASLIALYARRFLLGDGKTG